MFVLIRKDWRAHLLPLTTIGLALAMLILTPLWAWQWYHSPFLGVLLVHPGNCLMDSFCICQRLYFDGTSLSVSIYVGQQHNHA